MAALPQSLESSQEQLLEQDIADHVTLGQDAWRRLRRNRLAVIGLVIISVFIVSALISFVWTPYPTWRQALGPTYQGPTLAHPLGLDDYGRDILSRVMGGAAIALSVGVGASAIASFIGILLGLHAAQVYGGLAVGFLLLIRAVVFVPVTIVGLVVLVVRYGGLRRSASIPVPVES